VGFDRLGSRAGSDGTECVSGLPVYSVSGPRKRARFKGSDGRFFTDSESVVSQRPWLSVCGGRISAVSIPLTETRKQKKSRFIRDSRVRV
jgi:hypothetical protein